MFPVGVVHLMRERIVDHLPIRALPRLRRRLVADHAFRLTDVVQQVVERGCRGVTVRCAWRGQPRRLVLDVNPHVLEVCADVFQFALRDGLQHRVKAFARQLADRLNLVPTPRAFAPRPHVVHARVEHRHRREQHIGIAVKRLKEIAKVDVNLNMPKIPYRETITGNGEGHYRHKKQSGGHGQFAEVFLRIEPFEGGFEFANAVVGGAIPKNFIPAVEKGVVEAMERGPLAGCVVEKMRVTVYDGKFHDVDSSEMAFKIASRMAFRDAMSKAKPVLMEPVITARIMIPDEFTGDISGLINHKRGRILGMDMEDGLQVVTAEVPYAEMLRFATELRSATQGSGSFEMEFARYEVVNPMIANEIIANFQAQNKEEEE